MWFDAVIWRWGVQYLIKKSEGEYQIKERLLDLLPGSKMTWLIFNNKIQIVIWYLSGSYTQPSGCSINPGNDTA